VISPFQLIGGNLGRPRPLRDVTPSVSQSWLWRRSWRWRWRAARGRAPRTGDTRSPCRCPLYEPRSQRSCRGGKSCYSCSHDEWVTPQTMALGMFHSATRLTSKTDNTREYVRVRLHLFYMETYTQISRHVNASITC